MDPDPEGNTEPKDVVLPGSVSPGRRHNEELGHFHQIKVGSMVHARTVSNQIRAFGNHIETGKQSDPFVEDYVQHLTLSFLADQLHRQKSPDCLLGGDHSWRGNDPPCLDPSLENPCDNPMIGKLFKISEIPQWKILGKEAVDKIIFRTIKPRNRLVPELMARGGMRIGKVFKLTPADVDERKQTVRDPESGRGQEVVFIPQKLADWLKEYLREKEIKSEENIFLIS